MYLSPTHYVPQIGSLRRPLLMWSMVATGTVAVIALVVGAPLALQAGYPFLGHAIYQAFSYVCHQNPDRSFFVAGNQFAVCSRCTGLYAGFTLATIVYPLIRSLRQVEAPPRKWLFIAAAPLALDLTVNFLGIWYNTHSSRFATGALLGAVALFYVMPGLMDLSQRKWHSKTEPVPQTAVRVPAAKIFSPTAGTAPSDYSAPERRI